MKNRGHSSDNKMRILIDQINKQSTHQTRTQGRSSLIGGRGTSSHNESVISTSSNLIEANAAHRYQTLKTRYDQMQVKYEEKKLEVCQLKFRLKELEGIKDNIQKDNARYKSFIVEINRQYKSFKKLIIENDQVKVAGALKLFGEEIQNVSHGLDLSKSYTSHSKDKERIEELEQEIHVYMNSLKKVKQENNQLKDQITNTANKENNPFKRREQTLSSEREQQMASSLKQLFIERQTIKERIKTGQNTNRAISPVCKAQPVVSDYDQIEECSNNKRTLIITPQPGQKHQRVTSMDKVQVQEEFKYLLNSLSDAKSHNQRLSAQFKVEGVSQIQPSEEDIKKQYQIRFNKAQKRLQQHLQHIVDQAEIDLVGVLQKLNQLNVSTNETYDSQSNSQQSIRQAIQSIIDQLSEYDAVIKQSFDGIQTSQKPDAQHLKSKLDQLRCDIQAQHVQHMQINKQITDYEHQIQVQESIIHQKDQQIQDIERCLSDLQLQIQELEHLYRDKEQQLQQQLQSQSQIHRDYNLSQNEHYDKILQLQQLNQQLQSEKEKALQMGQSESEKHKLQLESMRDSKQKLEQNLTEMNQRLHSFELKHKDQTDLQIMELRKQVQDKNAEIDQQRTQNLELEAQLEIIERDNEECRCKLEEMAEFLRELKNENQKINSENQSLEAQIHSLENQAERIQIIKEGVSNDLANITKQNDELKVQIEQNRRDSSILQQKYESALQQSETFKIQVTKLEEQGRSQQQQSLKQIEHYERLLDQNKEKTKELILQLQEQREVNRGLESENQKKDAQSMLMGQELQFVKQALQNEKEKSQKYEENWQELVKLKEIEKDQSHRVSTELQRSELVIKQVQDQNIQMQETIDKLQYEILVLREQLDKSAHDRTDKERKLQDISSSITRLTSENEALTSKQPHLLNEIDNLSKEVKNLKSKEEELMIKNERLSQQLRDLQQESKYRQEKSQADIQILSDKLSKKKLSFQNKIKHLQQEAHNIQEELLRENKQVKQDLSQQSLLLKQIEDELRDMKQTVDSQRSEHKKKVDQKTAEVEKLKKLIDAEKLRIDQIHNDLGMREQDLVKKVDQQREITKKYIGQLKTVKERLQQSKKEVEGLKQQIGFVEQEKLLAVQQIEDVEAMRKQERDAFKKDLSDLKERIIELNREVEENHRLKEREMKQLVQQHEQQLRETKEKQSEDNQKQQMQIRRKWEDKIGELSRLATQIELQKPYSGHSQMRNYNGIEDYAYSPSLFKDIPNEVIIVQRLQQLIRDLGQAPKSTSLELLLDQLSKEIETKKQDDIKISKQLVQTQEELETYVSKIEPIVNAIRRTDLSCLSDYEKQVELVSLCVDIINKRGNIGDSQSILNQMEQLLVYHLNKTRNQGQTYNYANEIQLFYYSQKGQEKSGVDSEILKLIESYASALRHNQTLAKQINQVEEEFSQKLKSHQLKSVDQQKAFADHLNSSKKEQEKLREQVFVLTAQVDDLKLQLQKAKDLKESTYQAYQQSLYASSSQATTLHYQSQKSVNQRQPGIEHGSENVSSEVHSYYKQRESEFLKMIDMNQKEIQRLRNLLTQN